MLATFSDRDVRQRSLVPPERLGQCQALVIGVGAVGRQVACQLAALGLSRMILIDHDDVRVENLAPQGYWPEDLGQPKVKVTAHLCRRIHPHLQVVSMADHFRRSTVRELSTDHLLAVFLCVDRIATREWIWKGVRKQAAFFVDGRMSGEVIRVLASGNPDTEDGYRRNLFAAAEAFAGGCTSRSTIYTASIAAGLMVGQFAKWLRRLPVDADVTLNLLASEWNVA